MLLSSKYSVVSINGDYNVGVGVAHRARTQGDTVTGGGGGIEHSQITEVYHIISGTGTLVTGGTNANAKVPSVDAAVKVLNGPSISGGMIQGGVSRKVEPGDVVIIPPNTPHWFSQIDSTGFHFSLCGWTHIMSCPPDIRTRFTLSAR